MLYFSPSPKLFQWSAIHFVALGIVTVGAVPLTAVEARAGEDDFRDCASDLIDAGIAADTAAAACSLAFRPTEISECVTDVVDVSEVAPIDALSACSRDRRPHEVANCVESIHDELSVSDANAVLASCHRSLLPERYAACVTGLADATGFDTNESLARCTAAGFRPENIAPTSAPIN